MPKTLTNNYDTLQTVAKKAYENGYSVNGIGLTPPDMLEILKLKLLAQSLWGKLWRHHLGQMVLSDDPVKYLSENIDA